MGGLRLDQARTLAVLTALGSPHWLVSGVSNRELRPLVEQRLGQEYTSSQMRYDLRKLTAHGLLDREGHRYWPTPESQRELLGLTQLAQGVLEPLVAGASSACQDSPGPRRGTEKVLRDWHRQLDRVCQSVGVGVASK